MTHPRALARSLAALVLLAVVPVLVGCAAASAPAATVTVTASPESTHTAAPVVATVPACSSFIGKSSATIFLVGSGPQCITGSSLATDKTGYGVTNCDPVDNKGRDIYYWGTNDPGAPDQNLYAAKVTGVVVVVPVTEGVGQPIKRTIVADYMAAVSCF